MSCHRALATCWFNPLLPLAKKLLAVKCTALVFFFMTVSFQLLHNLDATENQRTGCCVATAAVIAVQISAVLIRSFKENWAVIGKPHAEPPTPATAPLAQICIARMQFRRLGRALV
jgi:hypothetical protein